MSLAGVLLSVGLQMVAASARQQAGADRHRAAVREAADAVELLATVPFDELTPERVGRLEAALAPGETLPGATLELELTPVEGPPAGKRVAVTVHWAEGGQPAARPVTLVRWRYR